MIVEKSLILCTMLMYTRESFIDKILFRIGHDDAEAWKVVILNDAHDAQMIVPFSVSHSF
jgi:hypothetical protein